MRAQKVHVEFDGEMLKPGEGAYAELMAYPKDWRQISESKTGVTHIFWAGYDKPVGVTLVKETAKAGEIWQDIEGKSWYVRNNQSSTGEIVLMDEDTLNRYPGDRDYPVLIQRLYPPEGR